MNLKILSIWLLVNSAAAHAFGAKHAAYVPDSETAKKIAEVVLEKAYGKRVLEQRPFEVKLDDGFWIIDGSTPKSSGGNYKGGLAHIEIAQLDGQIRSMIHGK